MEREILLIGDIKLLVNEFYSRVREDELLAPVFNNIIQDRWPQHLEKMYRFWQTVLLEEHTYHGSPFAPHALMPLSKQHFEHWISLFNATIDAHFSGKKADEAKWRAEKMADMFYIKNQYFRTNPGKLIQ